MDEPDLESVRRFEALWGTKKNPTLGGGGVREGMVTLKGLPSAGVCVEVSWVGDHDIRRPPLVRRISFLD
jgi:hypothetical protein